MNTKIHRFILGLALSALCLPAASEGQVSTDGTARASIVQSLSLQNLTVLDFGEVARSDTPGTLTINLTGSPPTTGTGGVYTVGWSRGRWRVRGEAGAGITIIVPSSPVVLSSATGSMTVDTFTHNAAATIANNGIEDFDLGATLNVGANQDLGSYTGTYTLTVAYN